MAKVTITIEDANPPTKDEVASIVLNTDWKDGDPPSIAVEIAYGLVKMFDVLKEQGSEVEEAA